MSIWEINKILDEIAVENGKGKEGQKVIILRIIKHKITLTTQESEVECCTNASSCTRIVMLHRKLHFSHVSD